MLNKLIKTRVSEKPMEKNNKFICEKLQITNDINNFYVVSVKPPTPYQQ